MSETGLPAWDEVGAEADRLQLASSAAELHGALCGWLAAGGANTPNWLAEVLAYNPRAKASPRKRPATAPPKPNAGKRHSVFNDDP